jgi:hypothetical protein
MHLFEWKAKRAGGRITVYGRDKDRQPAKIVGVDKIEPRGSRIIATDKAGDEHDLRF